MTALLTGPLPGGGTLVDGTVFGHTVFDLRPIDLAAVRDRVGLQTRVDRKYFVDRSLLAGLIEDLSGQLRRQTVDGRTGERYRSIYFDTPDHVFFHQHLQGRRRRFKVRTRSYLDSGLTMLEVKAKGLRSATVKERLTWPEEDVDRLGRVGDDFVARVTGTDRYRGVLEPSVETRYRRITLVDETSPSRITCDTDLTFHHGPDAASGPDTSVLVETKSATGRCAVDRWLLDHGIRPLSMSKYCLGIALLNPHRRANPWHRVLRRHFGHDRPAARSHPPRPSIG